MARKLSLTLFVLLVLIGPVLAIGAAPASAACSGPGAPTTTQTQCVTAILIPGNPLQSFDISFVNPHAGSTTWPIARTPASTSSTPAL